MKVSLLLLQGPKNSSQSRLLFDSSHISEYIFNVIINLFPSGNRIVKGIS